MTVWTAKIHFFFNQTQATFIYSPKCTRFPKQPQSERSRHRARESDDSRFEFVTWTTVHEDVQCEREEPLLRLSHSAYMLHIHSSRHIPATPIIHGQTHYRDYFMSTVGCQRLPVSRWRLPAVSVRLQAFASGPSEPSGPVCLCADHEAWGAWRLTAGPNAETCSDRLSGPHSQTITADKTFLLCFCLRWKDVIVAGLYSYSMRVIGRRCGR